VRVGLAVAGSLAPGVPGVAGTRVMGALIAAGRGQRRLWIV